MKRSMKWSKNILDSPVLNQNIKFFPSGNKLRPLKSKLIKLLPQPLKPTKCVPPKTPPAQKPAPKPRILSKRPVPIPRTPLPRPISEKVKKS